MRLEGKYLALLGLKIQGPALPFQEISDPFLSLLPAVPRGLLPRRGLEEASEQRNLISPQPPKRSHSHCEVLLHPVLFRHFPPPRGGLVLKSPSLAPAQAAGKYLLVRARPTTPFLVVAGEMMAPGGNRPLCYPPTPRPALYLSSNGITQL